MNKYGQAFSKGLIKENPVLRLVLGTCPTLAVTTAAINGLGMGAGFTGALIVMGAIREFFGNGTIFGWPEAGIIPPITVFVLPAGGFFVFGMLIRLVGKLSARLEGGKAVTDLTAGGCAACPHASACGQLGQPAEGKEDGAHE